MNDREGVRFESVAPQFSVSDVVRTAEHYRDFLGFQIAGYWGTPPVFAIVSRGNVEIYFNQAADGQTRTGRAAGAYDAYVQVAGVDALAAELRDRRAEILEGPEDRDYAQRELVVRDCNGLVIAFGQETERGAETAGD